MDAQRENMGLGEMHIIKTKVPKEWISRIKKRMREKGFATYDEYLRHLIRQDLSSRVKEVMVR